MANKSLIEHLADLFPDSNRTRYRQWIKSGRVTVDGEVAGDPRLSVSPGSVVKVGKPHVGTPTSRLKGGRILYEDDDLIVADKAAGILTVPAPGGGSSLLTELRNHLKKPLYTVHRLDRETSGPVMFAKTENIRDTLQLNWNDIVEERKYIALVEGELAATRGVLRSYLKENRAQRVYATDASDSEARLAVLHYRVLQSGRYSLVEIELETGRKNQIRAQFQELGHPVAGDPKYGATTDPIGRLALHAHTLRFRHPRTNEMLAFVSDLPEQFLRSTER